MDIKQVLKWTLTCVAVTAFHYVKADLTLPDDAYRAKYDRTEAMPNHLAYLALMQGLAAARHGSGEAENIGHVRTHLSLDRAGATRFLDVLRTSYDAMTDANRQVTTRILCSRQERSYEPTEAYAVLDALDDIKETNLRRQYRRAVSGFDSETVLELDDWLDSIKTGATHYRYDHRRVFELSQQDVGEVISIACSRIARH